MLILKWLYAAVILILKRLTVWCLEMSSEALLLGLFLTLYDPIKQQTFLMDLSIHTWWIAFYYITSAYFLTRAILRLVWTWDRPLLYQIISVLLFLIHFQICFLKAGLSTQTLGLLIQAVGSCIVFACTFAGSFILRKWGGLANPEIRPANSIESSEPVQG
jgi:hypothetical protein